MTKLAVRTGEKPVAPVPADAELWGGDDPRFGIDEDRPGWRGDGSPARWSPSPPLRARPRAREARPEEGASLVGDHDRVRARSRDGQVDVAVQRLDVGGRDESSDPRPDNATRAHPNRRRM